MIPHDSDRQAEPPPLSNGELISHDPMPTATYFPADRSASRAMVVRNKATGVERFDFLAPPRAPGEYGWLAHYRILSLLGEGGMGVVFMAEDSLLCRPVALKVIRPEIADSPGIAQRFIREARATAAIRHDNIVTIYQVSEERGVPFLAMEYLRGMSLAQWLDRGHRPSAEVVLRIGREIAEGLSAAHGHRLIHRDIKPANIWLEAPSGRVKILDFGMARSQRDDIEITANGAVIGTPAYMAPEQARGEAVGAGSDLFSLGCVLYRLATLRLPFEGGSIIAVLSAISTLTPPAPRDLNSAIPPALSDLIMRLLHKMPEARPVSAEVVARELKSIEREILRERFGVKVEIAERPRPVAKPDQAGREEFVEGRFQPQTAPQPRTRRWATAMIATLAALLAGVAGGGLMYFRRHTETGPAAIVHSTTSAGVVSGEQSVSRGQVFAPCAPRKALLMRGVERVCRESRVCL